MYLEGKKHLDYHAKGSHHGTSLKKLKLALIVISLCKQVLVSNVCINTPN